MEQLVSMFAVQVVQCVQGVEDLHLRDPGPPQPLEEVNLLDGETRLLTLLEHPVREQNNKNKELPKIILQIFFSQVCTRFQRDVQS